MADPFSAENPLIIDCCGDSTVQGVTFNGSKAGPQPGQDGTVGSIVAMPAPEGLAALLTAKYGPTVQVRNNGRSATTATDWLNGTNGVPVPWPDFLASAGPIVTLCLGINDQPDEFAAALPRLIDGAKAAGKLLVIQTPNAIDIPWGSVKPQADAAIGAAIAADLPLIDVYSATADLGAGWDPYLSYSPIVGPQKTVWCGIHPSQDGYTVMAAIMAATVGPLVAALLGFPDGRLATANPLPGVLVVAWDTPGMAVVNVLPPHGPGYWDSKPGVLGVSYAVGHGKGGRAIFALPAGSYRLELAAYWQADWQPLELLPVTVT